MEKLKLWWKSEKLRTSLFLIFLASVASEILWLVYSSIFGGIEQYKPFSAVGLPWFWAVGALWVIVRFANKHMNWSEFILIVFSGVLVSFLLWAFIPSKFDVPSRFVGINYRASNETATKSTWGEPDSEEFIDPLRMKGVYRKGGKNYKIAMNEYKKMGGSIGIESFIFWQTGVAHGYNPIEIRSYNLPNGFFDYIELFFTIGPVVLVECLIRGVYYNLMIFLFFDLITFWRRGIHFFEHEKPVSNNFEYEY
jgi:hypothetical protein